METKLCEPGEQARLKGEKGAGKKRNQNISNTGTDSHCVHLNFANKLNFKKAKNSSVDNFSQTGSKDGGWAQFLS